MLLKNKKFSYLCSFDFDFLVYFLVSLIYTGLDFPFSIITRSKMKAVGDQAVRQQRKAELRVRQS